MKESQETEGGGIVPQISSSSNEGLELNQAIEIGNTAGKAQDVKAARNAGV